MNKETKNKSAFRCVLHGSFRKHFEAIQKTRRIFTEAGIEVLAPRLAEITSFGEGFALLKGEEDTDPRMIELLYLHNLKRLGEGGFSYFVNPEGYLGKSASYELGIAQVTNVRCFFLEKPDDHPAYVHKNSIWKPADLATFIQENSQMPEPKMRRDEQTIHELWEGLMVPGSVVAAGGIIEYDPGKYRKEKEILLVKTHKWGGRYSIVGGKVHRNERLEDALRREIKEETGLDVEIVEFIGHREIINIPENYHGVVFFHLGKPKHTDIKAKEDISQAKFFSIDEIKKL